MLVSANVLIAACSGGADEPAATQDPLPTEQATAAVTRGADDAPTTGDAAAELETFRIGDDESPFDPSADSAGSDGSSASSTTEQILRACPCRPFEFDLFHNDVYSESLRQPPASRPEGLSDTEIDQRIADGLEDLLFCRGGDDLVARGLAVFDDPTARVKIRDVALRSALVLLLETPVEPVVEFILNDGPFAAVRFGSDLPRDVVAFVGVLPDGSRIINFNAIYQFEHPALLAPILAHESLHNMGMALREEEGVATLIQHLVLGQMIRDFPEMLNTTTELSQFELTEFFGLIFNSKNVLESRGELFPGGLLLENFYYQSPVARSPEGATPGSPLLLDVLNVLGLGLTSAPDYSTDLLVSLDIARIIDLPGGLEPSDLRTLADLLHIDLDAPRG